ncbi:MAG: TrbI/VirB10 family protein [Rhodocyclaceae bacterium]|nr:TrbI/VirB10 family protein [Rhodocyclaceae bacterium]
MDNSEALRETKNVSRRIVYVLLAVFAGMVGLLVLYMTVTDTTERLQNERLAQAEAQKAQTLAGSGKPTHEEASQLLQDSLPPAPSLPAPPQTPQAQALPPFEIDLEDIDRRARQRMRAPAAPQQAEAPTPARADPASMPEIYDVGAPRPMSASVAGAGQGADAAGAGRSASPPSGAAGSGHGTSTGDSTTAAPAPLPRTTYSATVTKDRPSAYMLNRGAVLDVVLLSEINTQNPGPVQLRVVSDVYDSLGMRKLVIPKGSKLVASVGSISRVGLDRVPIVVQRITFPDGRVLDLESAPVVDPMGAVGAPAEHHSNILRAVGPSALVALLSYWVDKTLGLTSVPVAGQPMTAAQSVSQQVLPKIEERIANRYGTAAPYYTIEAGARLNLMLTQDVAFAADEVK